MKKANSVFHKGEVAIQERLGVAQKMAKFGKMVVRDFMPQQHRDFYQQLPMLFVGHQDNAGQVWASVLTGKPGFITSPRDKSLNVQATPIVGDPLLDSINNVKNSEKLRLGILGIELATRRRNRLSAEVRSSSKNKIELDVLQTFGNCPQYIQSRKLLYCPSTQPAKVSNFSQFSQHVAKLIRKSDTFLVASSSGSTQNETHGADVSHRGGNPGFVMIESDSTLLIPDFTGNNHFNTLGNFEINPAAGLLFLDFENGDLITMTGRAEVLWDHPLQNHYEGAERFWRFKLTTGFRIENAFPLRFTLKEWSPNTLMTGNWQEAKTNSQLKQLTQQWHRFKVSDICDESPSIRSFWLESNIVTAPKFKAGQFITLRASIDGKEQSRTYTISSSPHDKQLRISVKRDGQFSNWLHNELEAGEEIDIRLPQGAFTLENTDVPAVLLSAGVGITPMISMFRYAVQESIRTRNPREILMINTFPRVSEQVFVDEISELSKQSNGFAKAIWAVTNAEQNTQLGKHYSVDGRVDQALLQRVLPIGRYQFYLCGPGNFMQDMYDLLLDLGVPDEDIKAESFGPAALKRTKRSSLGEPLGVVTPKVADTAIVSFHQSQVEQAWSPEAGTLLEFAEAHGISPEFGCRAGSCGSCKVKITEGAVVHSDSKTFATKNDEVLLCCAKPKKGKDGKPVKISLEL